MKGKGGVFQNPDELFENRNLSFSFFLAETFFGCSQTPSRTGGKWNL
jgi:hypothetical protein